MAIKRALAKSGINQIDEVIMGCVLQAGLEQAPVRQAALFTGLLDHTLPCTTVNKVCMSGMKAIMLSATTLSQGLQVSDIFHIFVHIKSTVSYNLLHILHMNVSDFIIKAKKSMYRYMKRIRQLMLIQQRTRAHWTKKNKL